MNNSKQVIVMRTDLGMRKGKMMAQAAHASMAFILNEMALFEDGTIKDPVYGTQEFELTKEEHQWLRGNHAKICVGVSSEEEMLAILSKAKERELTAHLITDHGLTEFNGVHTNTCIAIGPHYPEKFVGLTDHLKLL